MLLCQGQLRPPLPFHPRDETSQDRKDCSPYPHRPPSVSWARFDDFEVWVCIKGPDSRNDKTRPDWLGSLFSGSSLCTSWFAWHSILLCWLCQTSEYAIVDCIVDELYEKWLFTLFCFRLLRTGSNGYCILTRECAMFSLPYSCGWTDFFLSKILTSVEVGSRKSPLSRIKPVSHHFW